MYCDKEWCLQSQCVVFVLCNARHSTMVQMVQCWRAFSALPPPSPHPHARAGARGLELELVWCVMSRPHSSQPAASGAQSGHTQVSRTSAPCSSEVVRQSAAKVIPTARQNKYILFLPVLTSITSRCYMAPQNSGGCNI